MREHYNLYYLFLEDKLKNQMPAEKKEKILEKLKKIYENINPP